MLSLHWHLRVLMHCESWRCHDMEELSALLALQESTSGSWILFTKDQSCGPLTISLLLAQHTVEQTVSCPRFEMSWHSCSITLMMSTWIASVKRKIYAQMALYDVSIGFVPWTRQNIYVYIKSHPLKALLTETKSIALSAYANGQCWSDKSHWPLRHEGLTHVSLVNRIPREMDGA